MAAMKKKPRVFVTQPVSDSALKRLRAIADVKVNADSSRVLSKAKLIAAVKKADILFSLLHDNIDRAVLAANPKLRAVCSQSITPDNIDVKAATRRGIPVTVTPPIVAEATADIHFGLMLAVARNMVEGDRMVRAGKFPGSQSNHLGGSAVYGKTIGLIGGGGRIGRATAKRANGFGMKLIYWSPRSKMDAELELGMRKVSFDELFEQADFVSIHAPLNAETRHMVGARQFAKMKPTAFIINTARGAIIDEKALIRALQKKQIAGAGLDVFEDEPFVSPVLRKMKNVVLTPHLGSAVLEVREQMANYVVDNIEAIINGKTPPNIVNREVLNS